MRTIIYLVRVLCNFSRVLARLILWVLVVWVEQLSFAASPDVSIIKEKVIFAVDLIRHGDRTPHIAIPRWHYPWSIGFGELTSVGVEQEHLLGKRLRKQYVEEWQLLPQEYVSGSLYVRSTDFHRTIQSAESVLNGLYPIRSRKNHVIPIEIFNQEQEDLLLVKESDDWITQLKLFFLKQSLWNEKTHLMRERLKFFEKLSGFHLRTIEQLIYFSDYLLILKHHHMLYPDGISFQEGNAFIELGEKVMVAMFHFHELSAPRGKRFLSKLLNTMQEVIDNKTTWKYQLFSAHDAIIMSVLNTLGVSFEYAPIYASRLNFLLVQKNKEYWLRITYNEQPVKIPFCENSSKCLLSRLVPWVNQIAF